MTDDKSLFQIALDEPTFNYQSTYRLSTATLGQIILALSKTLERVKDPGNKYQEILYPKLQSIIPPLIETFKKSLVYSSEKDRGVRFYNIGGKLPVEIKAEYHNNIRLGTGNCGPLLNAALQRASYISSRDTPPNRFIDDEDYKASFAQLKEEMTTYHTLLETSKKDFENTINEARNSQGVDMDNVRKTRKDKQTDRKKRSTGKRTLSKPDKKYEDAGSDSDSDKEMKVANSPKNSTHATI